MAWFQGGSRPKIRSEDSTFDVQLVNRLKRREKGAFLELYDHFSHAVYRFLLHMTGSVAVAEELTQEVFVCILDALANLKFERFDPEQGSLEGYLLGIARNLARKEIKRNLRTVPLDPLLENSAESSLFYDSETEPRVLETILLRMEQSRLQSAILQLPPHYRETIVLCALNEKSYQEAAKILGCSEGTISSRMTRAKALLASILKSSKAIPQKTSQVGKERQ